MEYVVKDLDDKMISEEIKSIIKSDVITDSKVRMIKNLMRDINKENEVIEEILDRDNKLNASWNKDGGSITLGDDTLIFDSEKTFMKMLNKVFHNRKERELLKDKTILENLKTNNEKLANKLNDKNSIETKFDRYYRQGNIFNSCDNDEIKLKAGKFLLERLSNELGNLKEIQSKVGVR